MAFALTEWLAQAAAAVGGWISKPWTSEDALQLVKDVAGVGGEVVVSGRATSCKAGGESTVPAGFPARWTSIRTVSGRGLPPQGVTFHVWNNSTPPSMLGSTDLVFRLLRYVKPATSTVSVPMHDDNYDDYIVLDKQSVEIHASGDCELIELQAQNASMAADGHCTVSVAFTL